MQRVSMEDLEWRSDGHGVICLAGEPFTGIAYRLAPAGWTLYEAEYRAGALCGPAREWYGPGRLAGECGYLWDLLHGAAREYMPDGRLRGEAEYELGFCLRRRRWDEAGQLTEDYALGEADPEYSRLRKRREAYQRQGQQAGALDSEPHTSADRPRDTRST